MSNLGKISFLIAALCFIVVVAIRFILGAWIPFLYILIAVAGASMALSFVADRKLYIEFFTLRTTKHGMNMGAMILLVFVLLFSVNYLSVRHNKTWDVTQEKLNSLSDQSLKLIESLDSDVEVKVFYKGADALNQRQVIRQAFAVYQESSPKFKVRYIDSYAENMLAQEYLAQLIDRDQESAFVFVEYDGRRIRVEAPFGEEQITSAIVKATRRGEKKIYFLTGHGERDLSSQDQSGLYAFQEEMKSASYTIEALSLLDKAEVPEDAALLAIIGPKQPYLDNELTVLRKYLEKGGKLFVAVDPGEKHNISSLLRSIGIDFKNNYVINLDPLTGQASATSLGVIFDKSSSVTESLPEGKTLTLFDLASEMGRFEPVSDLIQVTELVKTAPTSFTMPELKKQVVSTKDQKSFPLYLSSKGKFSSEADKEFYVIASGDSDFLTNRLFLVGSNRDLAMNTLAGLTGQDDLISIRPKEAKGSKLILTSGARLGMILGGVFLPIALLLLSGVLWYRRRGA